MNNNFENILNGLKNQKSKEDAQEYLMKNLNSSQSEKLNSVLNDRKTLEKMLSSKEAQEILKKLTGENNG